MAAEELGALDAPQLVKELRRTVRSGRTRTEQWRKDQLKGILRLVEEQKEELEKAVAQDLGKSEYETYVFELSAVVDSCKLGIKELKKWMAPQKVPATLATYPSKCSIVAEPLGVALIISAWNFPILLAIDPMIGAISAGCAIVLKPSEIAPLTSALLAQLIPMYLDPSAIRVVEGGVPQTTVLLEQKWDKIFYTGNPKVGRIIMAAASKHLTPVTLELGGKCPVYVDSTVDLKVTARRIAVGKWAPCNGQACISPDYLLVEEGIVPELVSNLKQVLVEFYGEDPKTSKDLAKIVNSYHFQRLTRLLEDPKTADKIIHGGEKEEKTLYIAPTLLLNTPLDSPIMSDEIFGPLLPIITVNGADEAIQIINDYPKPLAVYVFTSNKTVQQQFVSETSSGGMLVNDTLLHFTIARFPFGGVGESGTGAYHGKFSFDTFSHKKSVLCRNFRGDVFARYPPYTTTKKNIVRSLLAGDFIGLTLSLLGLK